MKCYDEYASEYDAWFMKNSNLLASEVKLIAKTLADGGDILSIGCGSGLMESILRRDFGIVVADGVEPSPGMAAIARRRGLNVSLAAAADFPVTRQYDTVLMNGCPSYIDDLDAAFAHAAEALKPGGRLVVADVPKDSAYALLYNLAAARGSWEDPLLADVHPPCPYPIEFVKSANWRTTEEKVSRAKARIAAAMSRLSPVACRSSNSSRTGRCRALHSSDMSSRMLSICAAMRRPWLRSLASLIARRTVSCSRTMRRRASTPSVGC